MSILPIVLRELRVAARRNVTFRNRVLVSGSVGLVAISALYFGAISSAASQMGGALFEAMSWIALSFCLLAGVAKTADSLSEEKREGTLGLLFLTRLRGYDIVLGKFSAMSLSSMHGLLAMLPIMAVSFLLGGVRLGRILWRVIVALANIQFFSLCTGVFVSSLSRVRPRAIIVTILLVALFAGLPLLMFSGAFNFFSPYESFHASFDANYRVAPELFWASLIFTQVLSWVLMVWASFVAPAGWHDQPMRPEWVKWQAWVNRWQFGAALRRAKLRAEMLERNPIFWLAGRNLASQRFLWIIACAGLAVATLMTVNSRLAFLPKFFAYVPAVSFILKLGAFSQAWFGLVWLVNIALKVRIAMQSCHCLAEARRNQAVEMLLTTPLTEKQIIGGQLLALQNMFGAPLFIIFTLEIIGGLVGSTHAMRHLGGEDEGMIIRGIGVVYFTMFALDAMAVVWTGMWFGLSCRNENDAVLRTVLYILVIPLAGLFFWPFGIALMMGVPIFFIANSRKKLLSQFRLIAIRKNSSSTSSYTPPPDVTPDKILNASPAAG